MDMYSTKDLGFATELSEGFTSDIGRSGVDERVDAGTGLEDGGGDFDDFGFLIRVVQ